MKEKTDEALGLHLDFKYIINYLIMVCIYRAARSGK
jgi:hypothetical protein